MWQSRIASKIHVALRSSCCVCLHLIHHQQGMRLEKVTQVLPALACHIKHGSGGSLSPPHAQHSKMFSLEQFSGMWL